MGFPLTAFPFATPYDPSEDPPTSIDPLGTVAQAERLAEVILPGLTARMSRARLLTFSAVSSLVAQTVVDLTSQDELRDRARHAFERLFVSAVVRRETTDDLTQAILRIPGTGRAKLALRNGEPLTRANFLKGQATNGANGVMARLARQIDIIDDEHRLTQQGSGLVLAWAGDEGLPGMLDGRPLAGEGGRWLARIAEETRRAVAGTWPGNHAKLWQELAARLRPDRAGRMEKKSLVRLLWADPTGARGRTLDLLKGAESTWRAHRTDNRPVAERAVMREGVKPQLGDGTIDALLRAVLDAIDAFEQASCLLQTAFDAVRWSISSRGAGTVAGVLADPRTRNVFERLRKRSTSVAGALATALSRIEGEPAFPIDAIEPLREMRDDVLRGSESTEALLDAVLDRHDRVQRDKRKGCWIERGQRLTLMPGFGIQADAPPLYEHQYLHPFRVMNAFGLMSDLGVVRGGGPDGGS